MYLYMYLENYKCEKGAQVFPLTSVTLKPSPG